MNIIEFIILLLYYEMCIITYILNYMIRTYDIMNPFKMYSSTTHALACMYIIIIIIILYIIYYIILLYYLHSSIIVF